MQGRFRLKVLAGAVGMGVATAAMAAAGPAQSANQAAVAHATHLKQGGQILGVLPGSHPVHVEVALQLRHEHQLHTFIRNAHSPSALVAKRALTPREFKAAYSPTPAQANKVAAYLRSHGFTHVEISPNRMLVSADGTSADARGAFNTHFARVRTAKGRVAYMNTSAARVPAGLQDVVLSVVGLQNVHMAHTFVRTYKGGPRSADVTGHYPTDWPAIYGGMGLQTAAGVPVGIITQGSLAQTIADLNTFTNVHNLPQVATQIVNTNGTSNDTSGVGEWNLDSQDIVGMAGGEVGKIIFYNMPTLANTNLVATFNTVVSRNETKIINVSLGECELYAQQDGSAAATEQIFQQAVAQGQTFSISTGDSGANECGYGSTGASWPANSRYVVAVSGTTVGTSGDSWLSETVWGDSGGSESAYEPQPTWQAGLFDGNHRGVADVAYPGDPASGAIVVVNGQYYQIGGTSLSAPMFAGFWARVIATKGANVGFAAPLLYQLPAEDFHDITSGSNGERAEPGYDLASGLGSIIMGKAMADLGGGSTPPPGNLAPTAGFTTSVNDLTVSVTNASSDSDGSIVARSWDFGDGTGSTQLSPAHTYAGSGTYSITLTVTDNEGASDSISQQVAVCQRQHGNKPCGGGGNGH